MSHAIADDTDLPCSLEATAWCQYCGAQITPRELCVLAPKPCWAVWPYVDGNRIFESATKEQCDPVRNVCSDTSLPAQKSPCGTMTKFTEGARWSALGDRPNVARNPLGRRFWPKPTRL